MIHSRLWLLAICALTLGAMTMGANAAQAAFSWLVLSANGIEARELKAGVSGEKDTAEVALLTKLIGFNIKIFCNTFELLGFNLEAVGKITEGAKAKFTGCYEETGGSFCPQHSAGQPVGTLVTNELKSELVLHELATGKAEVLIKVEPKVAKEGFLVAFSASEEEPCFYGIPVTGVLYLRDSLGQATTFAVKHLLEPGPLTDVLVGKNLATLDGSIWVKLNGEHQGLKWSAMDV
jgi:hypothetical protein